MKTKLLLLCVAGLLVALTRAQAATHYVDAASTNPVPPYADWPTAAAAIQDAVDAALAGDEIVVTNGVYQTGARAVYGMSNRVAVTKAVTVRSVNGPEVTRIIGSGPTGPNAVRCVYLTNAATLAGFTLTNGVTQTTKATEEGNPASNAGGGVWCESQSAVVTNCILAGNTAFKGAGAYSGTLNHCTLTGNSAIPTIYASIAGGAFGSALNNCTLTGNRADLGGGAYSSALTNCTLIGNLATDVGAERLRAPCSTASSRATWRPILRRRPTPAAAGPATARCTTALSSAIQRQVQEAEPMGAPCSTAHSRATWRQTLRGRPPPTAAGPSSARCPTVRSWGIGQTGVEARLKAR